MLPEVLRSDPCHNRIAIMRTPALAVVVACAAAPLACESTDGAQTSAPTVVALGSAEAPAYNDGDTALYASRAPVYLPIRSPTSAELSALTGPMLPYPRLPYLRATDESVEVDYVVSNLDSAPRSVWILLDPWNEFARYRPAVQSEPALSGLAVPVVLSPLQRVQGNIPPSQMSVLAARLATAMAIEAPTFEPDAGYTQQTLLANDMDPDNIPGPTNTILAPFVPTVIAGVTGFDLALAAIEPVNVALEVTVHVVDASGQGKVLPAGATSGGVGLPSTFLAVQGLGGGAVSLTASPRSE
jgi:hypothetical protein